MSCVGRACNNAATSPVSVMPASWDVVCSWAHHPVWIIHAGTYHILNNNTITRHILLKHHHSAATPHHRRCWRSCRTHENCMHAEQIIIIINILYFIFCSICLVLFSIVLYRTIVTVYTENNFLYNYLRQMHQIILLSPLGCFTPTLGKTVQKNREVSWVNTLSECRVKLLIHWVPAEFNC